MLIKNNKINEAKGIHNRIQAQNPPPPHPKPNHTCTCTDHTWHQTRYIPHRNKHAFENNANTINIDRKRLSNKWIKCLITSRGPGRIWNGNWLAWHHSFIIIPFVYITYLYRKIGILAGSDALTISNFCCWWRPAYICLVLDEKGVPGRRVGRGELFTYSNRMYCEWFWLDD